MFTSTLVRLEMENCKFTTTQDMFLERVGITNSFNDDNEFRHKPFFVSKDSVFSLITKFNVFIGSKWNPILPYKKERTIFCHFIIKEES